MNSLGNICALEKTLSASFVAETRIKSIKMKKTFTFKRLWLQGIMMLMLPFSSISQTAEAPRGTGTSCDPYLVTSLNNLYWISQNSSTWSSGNYFVQLNDIDASSTASWNSGQGWEAIGNLSARFYANYDGRGNTISNLYINRSGSGIGFFGFTQSGTIENMHFDGATLIADITSANGVGIISAYSYLSTFENCTITNSTFTTSGSQNYAGTMFGRMSNVTVSYCSSDADASHSHTSGVHAPYGGLIGTLESGGTISYCYSTGDVTKSNGGNRTGGFMGIAEAGTISNCYATGSVSSSEGGGFVGNAYLATFNDCYATGDVHGTASSGKGSFAGFVQSGTTFNRCYGVGAQTGYSGGWSGGFSGYTTNGTFTNCFFDQTTTGYSNAFGYSSSNTGSPTASSTTAMTGSSTFTSAGWDFTNVWTIAPGVNNGYPTLNFPTYTMSDLFAGCNAWEGSTSNDWATSSNWTLNSVPVSGENIVISATAVNDLVLDTDRTIGDLFFKSAGVNVVLGANELTASGIHDYDHSNYIETNGSGILTMTVRDAQTVMFPVGNAYSNAVLITNNSGTTDDFSVKVIDYVYQNGSSGPILTDAHVGVTWDIHKALANAGSGIDFTFEWFSAQEQGTLNGYGLIHHNASNWEAALGSSATPVGTTVKRMVHTNYTGSFSPFAIFDGVALPVTLTTFAADCVSDGVELKWQTISEKNSSHFVVERSSDMKNWAYVGELNAAGNSTDEINYELKDERKQNGTAYYRLVQYDKDGVSESFGPISSNCTTELPMTVAPNPTADVTYVRVEVPSTAEYTLRLVDVNGLIIEERKVQLPKGNNAILLDVSALTAGVYFVELSGTNKRVKLLKN